jgi:MYXO-CTERM domain-containing protein
MDSVRRFPSALLTSFTAAAALAACTVAASAARADVVLETEDGFTYDIDDYGGYGSPGGEVTSGGSSDPEVTGSAFARMFRLEVNGVRYITPNDAYGLELAGRQLALGEVKIAGVFVRRLVYVPAAVGEFVRYLDVIRNPQNKAVTVTVSISGRTAYGGNLLTSSSGDAVFGAADTWFSADDATANGGNLPTAYVIHDGAGTSAVPSLTSASGALLEWEFEVTIPAYGQRAVLSFASQSDARGEVQAEASRLVSLPTDAVRGIEAFAGDIVNFAVDGAPLIRGSLPYTLPEGTPVPITLEVFDREDDSVTWSWDLDGNGVFGEAADTLMQTLAVGVTDGDRAWAIGVRATDGVLTREREFVINVTNVAPEILSLPDLRPVSLDEEWVYEVDARDPAVQRDPLTYTLVTAPESAAVSSTGVVTWTPSVADRGTTADFVLQVSDGDGGIVSQEWSLTALENRAPEPPVPYYPVNVEVYTSTPTLSVTNGTDADGDALVYRFRIDRSPSFSSEDLRVSADVVETADITEWTVPVALEPGVWYWQARVSDGRVESDPRGGRFVWAAGKGDVLLPDSGVEPLPIPEVGALDPSPECGVGSPASGAGSHVAWAWLAGLAALGARRRRR